MIRKKEEISSLDPTTNRFINIINQTKHEQILKKDTSKWFLGFLNLKDQYSERIYKILQDKNKKNNRTKIRLFVIDRKDDEYYITDMKKKYMIKKNEFSKLKSAQNLILSSSVYLLEMSGFKEYDYKDNEKFYYHITDNYFIQSQKKLFELLLKNCQSYISKKDIEKKYYNDILIDKEKIDNQIYKMAEDRRGELRIISNIGGMHFIYNNYFQLYSKILDEAQTNQKKAVKWISKIEKEDIDLVNIFLKKGMKIRHTDTLIPINFAVSDRLLNATVEKMENGKMIQSLFTNNQPSFIRHYQDIFEDLWKNGIDAHIRIKNLENNIVLSSIENIQNPEIALNLVYEKVENAKNNILIFFSDTNAFKRQFISNKIDLLASLYEKNGAIKIIVPLGETIDSELSYMRSKFPNIQVRRVEQNTYLNFTLVIIDHKECFIIEVKGNFWDSINSIGITIYSKSKSMVLSYVSIFESFWRQTEVLQQLKRIEMQEKEFINIAAHELRTPIQPILSVSEIMSKQNLMPALKNEVEIVYRNAKKLQRYSENLLDASIIESQSLKLVTEEFDIINMIKSIIEEISIQRENNNNNTIKFINKFDKESFLIKADRHRINQVIFNLVANSVKFTKNGKITIKIGPDRHNNNKFEFKITDNGTGIDNDLISQRKLFEKFSSKANFGVGLGLFICKGIILAHNGTISAKNNRKKGATFSFSIPILHA